MKILSLTVLFLIFSMQIGRTDSAEDAALKASKAWLDLVDSGKYDVSWEEAAMTLRIVLKKRNGSPQSKQSEIHSANF